jgi:hypothetical protein
MLLRDFVQSYLSLPARPTEAESFSRHDARAVLALAEAIERHGRGISSTMVKQIVEAVRGRD